jgi:tetratricopeptide (TPR) repeat protein
MSKGLCIYFATGAVAIAVAATAALWLVRDQPQRPPAAALLAAFDPGNQPGGLSVRYPLDQAVFPPDIAAPRFRWDDSSGRSTAWLVHVDFPNGGGNAISVICQTSHWTPSESQWRTIQRRSVSGSADVTVLGFHGARWPQIASSGKVSFSTSPDEVGAPIFYREVNLPFRDAVNDPSAIRWRFGDVTSREPPPVVLENLPVCGNCHSFSADGQVLGMDVDYASDKGSYAIVPVGRDIVLDPTRIITWSDYEPDEEEITLGLLSQVSPDGHYVASTVKDDSVFAPMPDLAFSQLFFPIKGIVAIYTRETGTYQALPGADDPQYVQTNPVWSPDGRWIVFARSKKYDHPGKGRLSAEECKVFTEQRRPFRYDLYRVPFNAGRGGVAEPLAGASQNGMSNYFPRYSPDGKWIVFCRARNYMLLQPDSELYIVPGGGGEARRLACNTSLMNSWHSWSPNGKWLVFSSKAFSPCTQLWLTHIDPAGNSSPPVLLANFTKPGRAANIPEFVRAEPDAIQRIREQFVDDYSYQRQAKTNIEFDDLERAEASARKALALNPNNARALFHLATVRLKQGQTDQTVQYLRAATASDPGLFEAQYALGVQLMNASRVGEAIEPLEAAVRLHPGYEPTRYHLALALQQEGRFEESLQHFDRLLELNPESTPALAQSAYIRATCPQRELRDAQAAVEMAERACKLTEYGDPEFLATLARVYLQVDRRSDAVLASQRAAVIARRQGRSDFANRVERDFRQYWQLPSAAVSNPR